MFALLRFTAHRDIDGVDIGYNRPARFLFRHPHRHQHLLRRLCPYPCQKEKKSAAVAVPAGTTKMARISSCIARISVVVWVHWIWPGRGRDRSRRSKRRGRSCRVSASASASV